MPIDRKFGRKPEHAQNIENTMICHYCDRAYSQGDYHCQGCGASRDTVFQTMLNNSTATTSWVGTYRKATTFVAIVTAVLLVLNFVFVNLQMVETFTVFWAMIIVPVVLLGTTVLSLKQGVISAVINFIFSIALWIGVIFITIVIVGSIQNSKGKTSSSNESSAL